MSAQLFLDWVTIPVYKTLRLSNPYLRFGVFASLPMIILYFAKPSLMFDENGQMRPWMVTSPNDPNSTILPFFIIGLLFGTFGVLI